MKQIELFYFLAVERRTREREHLAELIAHRLSAALVPIFGAILGARRR